MKAHQLLVEFYDPEADLINKTDLSDTRRPRLTLKHLNKLRKLRDIEREEKTQHLQRVQIVYKSPEEGGGESPF